MRAHDFITEAYQLPPRMSYNSYTVRTRDGDILNIHFEPMGGQGNRFVMLTFTVNSSLQRTNRGDPYAILATVEMAVNDFVRKRRPWLVVFTADEEDPRRVSVYDKLAQRWSNSSGPIGQYANLTDHDYEWPFDLHEWMDEVQPIEGQKIYVLASNAYFNAVAREEI